MKYNSYSVKNRYFVATFEWNLIAMETKTDLPLSSTSENSFSWKLWNLVVGQYGRIKGVEFDKVR